MKYQERKREKRGKRKEARRISAEKKLELKRIKREKKLEFLQNRLAAAAEKTRQQKEKQLALPKFKSTETWKQKVQSILLSRRKRRSDFVFSSRNKRYRFLSVVQRFSRRRVSRLNRRWSWIVLGRWVKHHVTRVSPNFKSHTNTEGRKGLTQDMRLPIKFFGQHYRARFRRPDIFRSRRQRLLRSPHTTFFDSAMPHGDERLRRMRLPRDEKKQRGKVRRDGVTHYKGMLVRTEETKKVPFDDRGTRNSNSTAYQQFYPRWSFALTTKGVRNHELRLRWVQPKSFVPTVCVSFVPTSRNFWGILHYRGRLAFEKTAGQTEQKGGPRRWKDKPKYEVVKLLGSKLKLLFQDFRTRSSPRLLSRRQKRGPALNRYRFNHRQTRKGIFSPTVDRIRSNEKKTRRRKPLRKQLPKPSIIDTYRRKLQKKNRKKSFDPTRFRLKIKLKNYVPYKKRWWQGIFSLLLRFIPSRNELFKISVLLETVVPRPHNGLRARKQIRQ